MTVRARRTALRSARHVPSTPLTVERYRSRPHTGERYPASRPLPATAMHGNAARTAAVLPADGLDGRYPSMARERSGPAYDAEEPAPAPDGGSGAVLPGGRSGTSDSAPRQPGELGAAIDALAAIDIDGLTDGQLAAELADLRLPLGRLRSLQARWATALESRRIASAPPQHAGAAQRNARNELAEQQQLTPSETKRLVEAGRAARRYQETGRAFADGQLTPDHVRVMDSLLTQLQPEQQARLEPKLLELAVRTNATLFGRRARALLAAQAPDALAAGEDAVRGRRYVRATDTPDGGFAFSGLLYGTAAETARIALDAFTRPDASGEHRTPEQRAADGFEQLCAAALSTEHAPAQHGTRPQVLVSIDVDQLEASRADDGVGVGHFVWSGQPVSTRELGHLFDDCSLVGVLLDAERTPIEVTSHVRTVPAGLYRALQVRDGGCSWDGCDAPAAWCDVAHGQHAFRDRGRLHPGNAALLCRSHHRRFDNGPWRMEISGDRVRYCRTTDPP